MNTKIFSLATLCILTLGLLISLTDQVSSAQDQPEVYLNNSPDTIVAKSEEMLQLPIFFVTGDLVNQDLEFYYWREVHDDGSKEYLNSECEWVPFFDYIQIQPLIFQAKLPAYLYVNWIDPPRKEQEPRSYRLHICIDSKLDEHCPDESQGGETYACTAQEVNLNYCIPENILLDGQVNPAKISDSVLEGVQPPSHVLIIRDDCDGAVSCQVTSVPYFVDQPAGNAILDGEIVQFKNNQSIGTHNGNIVLECPLGGESITKEIPVELVVTSSSHSCEMEIFFQMTDGFPPQVARDGGQIRLSVRAGEEKSISLTCGKTQPLSDFEANVSGSGCFRVEKDISPGKYSKVKIIPVSSTDCSDSLTVSSGATSATASVHLNFNTSSSLSISPSDINKTLSLGKTWSETIYVTCSGTPASSCSVSDPGESWLDVSSCTSGHFTLTLNTQDLNQGDKKQANLEVKSSCGSRALGVSLTVEGVCIPKTAELSRNLISVSVTHGSNAGNQSVRIEDNCGNPLAFQIDAISDNWIKSPEPGDTGNGNLNVDFDTASLAAENYNGSIYISTALGNLILRIKLTVSSGTGGGVSAITLTKGDAYRDFDFKTEEVKLFKFRADSGPSNPTLTVVAEVQSGYGNQNGNLHMMAKYAGQDWEIGHPTETDYGSIMEIVDADWTKSKGIYNSIYYYTTRTLVKRISINRRQQVTDGCWYVWVKNIGDIGLNNCMVHFGF